MANPDPRPHTVQNTFNKLENTHSDELVALVSSLQASILSDLRRGSESFDKQFNEYQTQKVNKLLSQSSTSATFGTVGTMAIINTERKKAKLPRIPVTRALESTMNKETSIVLKKYKTMIDGGYTVIDGKKVYWLKDADKNARKVVYEAVKVGVEKGKSVVELTKDLDPIFSTLKTNAKLTAHHELTYISDLAGDMRKKNQGIKLDRWVSVGDNRVRPLHQEFDGQYYPVGGGEFPSFYLNCRCVRIPVVA